jgi:CO/xanthine dehydrogenase Mo-binding subunit
MWSRADELAWSPVGAAAEIELSAELDADGAIIHWQHDVWSNGHVSRPGRGTTPTLLAGYHLAMPAPRLPAPDPPLANGGGSERNAVPDYDLPAWRIRNHRLLTMPLRVSSLRTLGAYANVFARESFMDELALDTGQDPIAIRLRYLGDPRSRAVLRAAADRADWAARARQEGRGHGVAFARYKNSGAYCAVVAEIVVEQDVHVTRLVCAIDAGQVINPDGLVNQIEGGAIQSTSWTLKEAVRFDRTRITSDSWDAYPILRFSEVPHVEVVVLDNPEAPSLGAGEAAHGPVAGAIANAVADAVGTRVRHLPLTRDALIAALG